MSAFGKQVRRSIAGSLGLFLAIAGIVALGCGFYAGLRMTSPDMSVFADAYYDATNLYDLRIVSTLGLPDEARDLVEGVEGVDGLMMGKSTDVMADFQGDQYAMRVSTMPNPANEDDANYLNRGILTEGRWPSAPGEAVLSADRPMGHPVEMGERVVALYGTSDLDDVLALREFTVVGLAHSPNYVSSSTMGSTLLGSGSITQFLIVTEESFAEDYPYTDIYIGSDAAREAFAGSDAYWQTIDALAKKLEGTLDDLSLSRLDEIRTLAQEELDEAKAEFADEKEKAEAELADAHADLDEARAKLDEGKAEIESGQSQIESGRAQVESGQSELDASRNEAYAQLDAAEEELAAREAELSSAEAQLSASALALDASRLALEASEQAWEVGQAQLDPFQQQVDELEAALAEDPDNPRLILSLQLAQAALDGARSSFDASRERLDEARAEFDASQAEYDSFEAQVADARAQLDAARVQLDDRRDEAEAELAGAQAQIDSSRAQLESARADLEAAKVELESGEAEYQEGKEKLEREESEARRKLKEAEDELAQAQITVDEIEAPGVYLLDRTKNPGVESFRSDSERIDHIARVFPFIFFLVAALVALTSMTRLVEEERVLIGTFKALGYSRSRITGKYVTYALLASCLGAAFGIAVLSQVLPYVICNAYAIIYNVPIPPLPLPFDWRMALIAAAMGVGTTVFATLAAAMATLREQPASLMLPRTPKAGKRILLERIAPLWSRLSFSWKVTARNIFRYKKRLFMTLVGIAGCTALLLTGLGLHNSIWDIIDKHYGPVAHATLTVTLDSEATDEDVQSVEEVLRRADSVDDFIAVSAANVQVAADAKGREVSVEAYVARDANLDRMFTLRERTSGDALEPRDGAIIAEKLANMLGVSPGGTILIYDQDEIGNAIGSPREVLVEGVAEYYIGTALFMSRNAYERLIDDEPTFTTFLATSRTDDEEIMDALSEQLHEIDAVKTVTFNVETVARWLSMLSSVNTIVYVLVASAAALAFIVLYNLTNINITERRREIASLKVLGFTPREVYAYIFREIILLSAVGALVGLVLGVWMEGFVITTAEVDYVMFGREIHATSFALAWLLTMAFTAVTMLLMRGKLRRIDMVESLKSVE